LIPYLQTHLTFGEIGVRLFISRNTVSTEVASIYRNWRLFTKGRCAACDGCWSARRLAKDHPPTGVVIVGVIPQRQLRGRRDSAGQPDDGTTPTSTSTISAAVAQAFTAASA
jgi:hypothetical protein